VSERAGASAGTDQPSGWEVDEWYVFTSVYTKHWDSDPAHVNHQKMIAGEARMKNHWVFGLGIFDNSFGQKSEYLYAGYKWDLFGSKLFYFKLTGGLLHGYKGEYKDKIPLKVQRCPVFHQRQIYEETGVTTKYGHEFKCIFK